MTVPLKVLIVEDSDDDVELVIRELRKGEFEPACTVATTGEELQRELQRVQWDLIISDYSMPGFDGLQCLQLYHEHGQDVPFILVSGTVGEELAVDAMRAGAHDYVMKGRLNRLVPAIKRELKEARVRRDNKRMTEYLEFIAYHDPVTRLPNERLFRDELDGFLAEKAKGKGVVAVAVMEIGNLRTIRNVLGTETVNLLMRNITERLHAHFRPPMCLGRLNESSFGFATELQGEADVEAFGSLCAGVFDTPIELEFSQLQVDTTIGAAVFPKHGQTAEAVLRNAYVAATQAAQKSAYFRVYSEAEDHATPERLHLLGELRHAIRDNDLLLHYQPIIRLDSGNVVAMEALVRWQHREHGLIPPGMFLEGAEQSGLIQPLTNWVIRSAFEQGGRWQHNGSAMPLFINLSVRALENVDLPDYVRKCLREIGVRPQAFGFEVTESAIMQDYEVASRVLHELNDMGFSIAIDDFGTGHSSLRYIQRLPIDHIKVDQSFITNLAIGSDEYTIVKAIMDIANNLGQYVVAEGVEREDTLAVLRDLGCHMAQGFLFGRPMAAGAIDELLAGWHAGARSGSGAEFNPQTGEPGE